MDATKLVVYAFTEEQFADLSARLDRISQQLEALAKERDASEKILLSVKEACAKFGISRSMFYEMLADPSCELSKLVVRIPPPSGRTIRVPAREFQALLERTRRGW